MGRRLVFSATVANHVVAQRVMALLVALFAQAPPLVSRTHLF